MALISAACTASAPSVARMRGPSPVADRRIRVQYPIAALFRIPRIPRPVPASRCRDLVERVRPDRVDQRLALRRPDPVGVDHVDPVLHQRVRRQVRPCGRRRSPRCGSTARARAVQFGGAVVRRCTRSGSVRAGTTPGSRPPPGPTGRVKTRRKPRGRAWIDWISNGVCPVKSMRKSATAVGLRHPAPSVMPPTNSRPLRVERQRQRAEHALPPEREARPLVHAVDLLHLDPDDRRRRTVQLGQEELAGERAELPAGACRRPCRWSNAPSRKEPRPRSCRPASSRCCSCPGLG